MDRRIKAIKKDSSGKIVALCNTGESWSPRRTSDVVRDILDNKKSYYVQELTKRTYVRVGANNSLVTSADTRSPNYLERLPQG